MSGVPEILIEPEMSRRRRRRAWRFATRVTQGTLCLANFCCSWTARPWRRRCDESSERPELHSKQHGVMSHRHVSPSGATVQTAWRHFSRSSEWCAMVCHIRTFRLYSRLPFWPPRAAPVRAPLLQAVIRRCLTVAAPLLSPVSHGGSTTPADRQSPVSHCGSTTPAGRQSPVSHRGSTATVAGVSPWQLRYCRRCLTVEAPHLQAVSRRCLTVVALPLQAVSRQSPVSHRVWCFGLVLCLTVKALHMSRMSYIQNFKVILAAILK